MEEENRLIKKRLRLVLKESDGYYKENVENQKDFTGRETIETIISSLQPVLLGLWDAKEQQNG